MPDGIYHVPEIPQTLNGKKLEVPVKRIFQGIELSKSVSREAMSNPDSLQPFLELAEQIRLSRLRPFRPLLFYLLEFAPASASILIHGQ